MIFISKTKKSLVPFQKFKTNSKWSGIEWGECMYVLSSGSVSNVSDNAYYYDIYIHCWQTTYHHSIHHRLHVYR